MDRGDIDRLKHMKRYCEDIADAVKYLHNSFDEFQANIHYYNSISMSIMQIGEISTGLSDEFKKATRAEMQWGLIRGMRNRFAHAYAVIEKNDIWETATEDIPVLSRFCDKVLEKHGKEPDKGCF